MTGTAGILFHKHAEQTPVPGGTRGTRNKRGTGNGNHPESRASTAFLCSAGQWNKVEQPLCSAVPPPTRAERVEQRNGTGRKRADRWLLIAALLRDPERESRRLTALLAGWPAEVRRHELHDDCRRRRGVGKKSDDDPAETVHLPTRRLSTPCLISPRPKFKANSNRRLA